ncbi:MAG: SDR family NAD(P)-dependent oxidoreductase [Cyanobacteria bacterium P01_E01_bin.34]
MNARSVKCAVVTGGNRGIGFAIAQGLLAKDFEVVISSRSLDHAKQAAKKLGERVMPLELDIGDDASIERAAKALSQSFDRLDVLVNNAGIYPDNNIDVLTASRELLMQGINTNTFGAIRMVQAVLPLLERSPDARIINVSSGMGALNGLTTSAPSYGLSKLALNGATIMLAQSLRSKGIAVNSMGPGWVKTDMGGASAPRSTEQGASTAVWLATEAPSGQTGKFWRDRQVVPF